MLYLINDSKFVSNLEPACFVQSESATTLEAALEARGVGTGASSGARKTGLLWNASYALAFFVTSLSLMIWLQSRLVLIARDKLPGVR
jgi:hypothetical protein